MSLHTDKRLLRCIMLISLCFLLTSTGWIGWEYHLMALLPAKVSDICTMVIGYLLQAVGIGFFAFLQYRKNIPVRKIYAFALPLHLAFMIPAYLDPGVFGSLLFGFLMNLLCGCIAGCYLYDLAAGVRKERRATAFAAGYGLSILASWLLSVIAGRTVRPDITALVISAVLSLSVLFIVWDPKEQSQEKPVSEKSTSEKPAPVDRKTLAPLLLLVFLFSLINSSGITFSSADIGISVNLELCRIMYAFSLLIAGIITDRSRKWGSILAFTVLITPLILLALRPEPFPGAFFWVLQYFVFGFVAVFRITLFSDSASEHNTLYLSGLGLLSGRAGDALGEALSILSAPHTVFHVLLTSVLFAVAVGVFFHSFQVLYRPAASEAPLPESPEEKLLRFSIGHDLSLREREMLRLILAEKTNAEIAEELSISENTVKFHVRNILQKTDCRNRKDLFALFLNHS